MRHLKLWKLIGFLTLSMTVSHMQGSTGFAKTPKVDVLKLPFNKKLDAEALRAALTLPSEDLIKFIKSKNTDILLVPVRTELDRELPKTWLEKSANIKKAPAPLHELVQSIVGSTHGNAGLMVTPNDKDGVKVSRNTIFVHEFVDEYTVIHEFAHSLMKQSSSAEVSSLEIYTATRNKDFVFNKVRLDWSLLEKKAWRHDVVTSIERYVELYPKAINQSLAEEVIIERLLKVISEQVKSPYINQRRVNNGLRYADGSLKSINDNFNVLIDQFTWILNEFKSRVSTAQGDELEDIEDCQQRLSKVEDKLRVLRAQLHELAKFHCELAVIPNVTCDKF